jgi:hypothetical protein
MIGLAIVVDLNLPEWKKDPSAYVIKLEGEARALNAYYHLGGMIIDVAGRKYGIPLRTSLHIGCGGTKREETTELYASKAMEITNWPKNNKGEKITHMEIRKMRMEWPRSNKELCAQLSKSANFPVRLEGKDFKRTLSLV